MKIVTVILLLPVAILSFFPERAWAPQHTHHFTGEAISVGVGEGATGEPWANIRSASWTWMNSPHNPDPDSSSEGNGGEIW